RTLADRRPVRRLRLVRAVIRRRAEAAPGQAHPERGRPSGSVTPVCRKDGRTAEGRREKKQRRKPNASSLPFFSSPLCRSPVFVSHRERLGHDAGLATRPRNRMLPVRLPRIRIRNGWSARKVKRGRGAGILRVFMPTPVAAAASLPSSLTSTNALWTTLLMY